MTTITAEQAELLRRHGFMWFRDQCTDRVEAGYIEKILPVEGGFACIYKDSCIAVSVVRLREEDSIEWPGPAELNDKWILVNWDSIKDFYVPGMRPADLVGVE